MSVMKVVAVGIFATPWIAGGLAACNESDDVPMPLPSTTVTQTSSPITPSPVTEDDPTWDCRTRGNHVCGPTSGHAAGCYRDGVLAVAWSNYSDPRHDPLWGQVVTPC